MSREQKGGRGTVKGSKTKQNEKTFQNVKILWVPKLSKSDPTVLTEPLSILDSGDWLIVSLIFFQYGVAMNTENCARDMV